MTEKIEVRVADADEVAELLRWAGTEGWNPGLGDAEAFRAADPQGFLGSFVDGRLAAGISAIRYGECFGFIGLYICHPDFRGRGLGMRVWNEGMERLAERTIGLDGVPAQQANYSAMGFNTAYTTARWSGRSQTTHPQNLEGVVPFQAAMANAVEAFDRRFFPGPRKHFLDAWLLPPHRTFLVEIGGQLRGYAVVRQCLDGYKLGPLFAEDIDIAIRLFNACHSISKGAELHLDVPDRQIQFSQFLASVGFTRGFETARMYRGAAPVIEQTGVFAITSLELG